MAEYNVFENPLENEIFFFCMFGPWDPKFSYLHFNMKRNLLDSSQLAKLAVDFRVKLICDKIFSLEYWTNSFKTELLSVILSHSGIEFDLLFNFTQSMTKSDWSFEDFWLTCFDYYAAGNSNCRPAWSAKI